MAEVGEEEPFKTNKKSSATVAPLSKENVNASVVAKDTGANVIQKLETTKKTYNKVKRTRGFITDVSQDLGLEQHEASQYGTFDSSEGLPFTLRISNHNTKVSTWDENGENNGISIVISGHRNKGILKDGQSHVVEFFYPKKAIEKSKGNPLVDIIDSIQEMLRTGVYKDITGIAKIEEVNYDNPAYREMLDEEYLDAVNKGDKETTNAMVEHAVKMLMPDTKVVDGEGNPIKVYHYGNKGINVFDREKARTTSDVQGMFFSDSQEDWSDYGDTKYAVYLDIKNPYIVDSYEKAKKVMPDLSKTGDGIRIREELQAEGYDGIINTKDYMGTEGNEYVVFDSNQIKSADPVTYDDAGKLIPLSERFNMDKDDMRFSFGEEDEDSNEIQWSLNEKEKDETIKRIDKRIAELNRLSEDEYLTISQEQGNGTENSNGGLPATKTGAYRDTSGAKVHKKIGFAKLLFKNISGFIEKKTKLSPETFGNH